jgi:hypothetical protein
MQFYGHIQAKDKSTHKSTIGAYERRRDNFEVHKTIVPQPTRLTFQQMDERNTRKGAIRVLASST